MYKRQGSIADSSYAVVAGLGSLEKAQQRELFTEGTARQHEFLANLNVETVPSMRATMDRSAPAGPEAPPANQESADVLDAPDFMLTPEAQAEKAARNGTATPEAQASLDNINNADFAGLDFNGARMVGVGENVGDIAYSENEFGDYNVVHPEKGKFVVRKANFNPNDIDGSLSGAIAYSDEVDGEATSGDWWSTLVSPLTDPTGFRQGLANEAGDLATRAFGEGVVSGMDTVSYTHLTLPTTPYV